MTKKKNKKSVAYWLRVFGFMKREKSIKEKMCEAACDLKDKYKKEAREATAQLVIDHEQQLAS